MIVRNSQTEMVGLVTYPDPEVKVARTRPIDVFQPVEELVELGLRYSFRFAQPNPFAGHVSPERILVTPGLASQSIEVAEQDVRVFAPFRWCVGIQLIGSHSGRFLRHRFSPKTKSVATQISLPKRNHVAKEAASTALQTNTRRRIVKYGKPNDNLMTKLWLCVKTILA